MPYVVVKTNVPAKALARAVYSRLPVIILDDVTSGLDPTMVNFILTQLFGPQGHFRKSGTSVILATHNRSVLPYMDEIIVMDNGVVVNLGSYSDIRLTMAELAGSEDVTDESSNRELAGQDRIQNQSTASAPTFTHQTSAANPQELDLQRRQGSWSVYAYYCRSAGTIHTVFWVVFTLAGAVSSNYMSILSTTLECIAARTTNFMISNLD
jgi:ATP-binding cassette subfamily C (CFTR/MRP) protein 1